ncbi:uncharacterized protein A1O9_09824 [Exophiala aquamarina CBS 119918]|uniref:G-protein coupled receptors family 1 profile domain-containing protein n=1 Tax=Exophiala aquamarina CBS 119918 TaxID=1182545 RepID=A0A072P1N5_9EURO|nr:uncharacterized protein A1O9_09824 [Exophiala aquamarina CBS 119918]KEF54029.1 hypothetical protein A1O9_09824 [Exophiala aquamarina CBS 119918]
MLLIVSDMCKAVWFFAVPLVSLVRGPVNSSSSFCQASGFLLAQSTEASDFAALMLALHLVSCVFYPPKRKFQGGLYNFRRLIYLLWVLLPIIAASLAFTNTGNAYVTYGTVCYLPGQPVWYRMALAWIPRYVVFVTILSVAFIVTIHVHLTFKRFGHPGGETATGHVAAGDGLRIVKVSFPTPNSVGEVSEVPCPNISARDFAPSRLALPHSDTVVLNDPRQDSPESSVQPLRAVSMSPSSATDITNDMDENCFRAPSSGTDSATEELLTHRHTIERHLRILFLYPVSYMLVWTLPFVSQCLQLTGSPFESQSVWLQILATGVLALQASVDAAVFSYRERPWKRAKGRALISKAKIQRLKLWRRTNLSSENGCEAANETCQTVTYQKSVGQSPQDSPPWWEAEGKKRRDSVWMGTDALSISKGRQQREDVDAIEDEEEDTDPHLPKTR